MSLGLLAAFLESERQVVEALGGFLFGFGRLFVLVTGGGPVVGNRGVGVLCQADHRRLGLRFARFLGAFLVFVLSELTGLCRVGERAEDVGQVVQLNKLGRVLE